MDPPRRAHSAASGRASPQDDSSDNPSVNDPPPRSNTPPAPLLRPAQGAWGNSSSGTTTSHYKTRPLLKPAQPQTSTQSPPSAASSAPGKRPSPSSYAEPQTPRMTHPESAQRHSQATGTSSYEHRDYYRYARQNQTGSNPLPTRGSYPPDREPPYSHYSPSAYTHSSSYHHRSSLTAPAYRHHDSPPDPAPASVSASASSASASAPRNQTLPPFQSMYSNAYEHQHQQQHPDQQTDIVVLLMEDVRHGTTNPDFQLAEVSVTLREATGGGTSEANVAWWADGEEVIRALQSTPSRLEGAAKVFARRGKYRQCFVRFSEDGNMECQPSSLQVSRERTIELIIEPNLEARPAYTPQDPYARVYPPSSTRFDDYPHYTPASPYVTSSGQPYYPPSALPPSANNGKRTSAEIVINPLNPGGDDHLSKRPRTSGGTTSSGSPLSGGTALAGGGGGVSSNVQMKRPARPQGGQPLMSQQQQGTGMPPRPSTAPQMPRPGSSGSGAAVGLGQFQPSAALVSPSEESPHAPLPPGAEGVSSSSLSSYPFMRQEPAMPHPPSGSSISTFATLPAGPGGKAPKEVINASIVAYLRSHIQNEEGYLEFAASKGRLLPIPDLLKGYRFATRIVNAWANRKTPANAEGCPNKRITKNHVLQALFRQTSWGSDCEQTLQLADRYGKGGQREDPRVVEILSGGTMLPEKSGDPKNPGQGGRSQGSVALLDFLKDVDREHKAKMEEEARRSAGAALVGGSGVDDAEREERGKEDEGITSRPTSSAAPGGAGE